MRKVAKGEHVQCGTGGGGVIMHNVVCCDEERNSLYSCSLFNFIHQVMQIASLPPRTL